MLYLQKTEHDKLCPQTFQSLRIKSQKLIVFDLNRLINSTDQDSVFIYSNLNSRNSFYLCKQFNSATNECFEPKDLFKQYGRTIPPEKSGLNIININDLQSLISDNKYTHLVVRLFVQLEANKRHQMFVKFDWYFRKQYHCFRSDKFLEA